MGILHRLGRPWNLASPLPVWLLIALIILAASATFRLAATPVSPDSPVDFRPLYLGQLMLLDGQNPYDDALLKDTWREVVQREGFETRLLPGYPRTLLLYPPWALPIFTVFAAAPWMVARAVWWSTLPFMLLGIVWLVARGAVTRHMLVPFVDILLLAIAFKATDWAFYVGQPMFLCLLLGFGSWHLERTNRPILSGIALGLASFKVTLAAPFVLLMFYRRRWRVLTVAATTGVILLGMFLMLNPDPSAALASSRHNVSALRTLVFSPDNEGYPIAFKMVSRTELAALAEALVSGSSKFATLINLAPLLFLLPFWVRPLAQGRLTTVRAFAFFAVMSLLCSHHLHYDCLVLLPLYLIATEVDGAERISLLAAGAIFLVPINGVLTLVDLPSTLNFVLFNIQIGLIGLAVVLTWGLRRNGSDR